MSRYQRLQRTMRSPYRTARRRNKPLTEEREQAYKAFRPHTEKAGRRILDRAFVMIRNVSITSPIPQPKGKKR